MDVLRTPTDRIQGEGVDKRPRISANIPSRNTRRFFTRTMTSVSLSPRRVIQAVLATAGIGSMRDRERKSR